MMTVQRQHFSHSLESMLYPGINRIQPTPQIGMAATIMFGMDREPATIVEIKNTGLHGKFEIVGVRLDTAKANDDGTLSFIPNTKGKTWYFRWRENRWEPVEWNENTNRWSIVKSGLGLFLGRRMKYNETSL